MTLDDQKEFLDLLRPVHTRLWRFVLVVARDRANAEDLMSETILAAYERFDTVRDRKAFTSFLFTIATRLERQRERRARWFGPFEADQVEAMPSTASSPELATEIALLLEALNKLGAKQRETLTLFEISGFTLEEIREIQGGTLSGVKSRLRRARHELAKILGVRHAEQGRERETVNQKANSERDAVEATRFLSLAINE